MTKVDEEKIVASAQAQKHIEESELLVPFLVSQQQKIRAATPDAPKPTPSGPEVAEIARKLGIDLVFDSDLLYIAEDLILSDLPDGWQRHRDDKGKAYYHNARTSTTQWAHPLEMYYRGLVFMRKEGDQLLEEKALHNPPTPEECREMAKYFGISPREEVYLMPIAKAAVNAPLPPEWEEYEDDDGEVYFVSKITKKTSEQHPLDGYFFELINQKRFELQDMKPPLYPMADFHLLDTSFVPYPWMEFVNTKTGLPFWYNFRDNLSVFRHPCELIKDVIRTEAVLRLQSWYRGSRVREANRVLVENLAATSIQKMYRGFTCRRMNEQRQRETELRAAVRIQSTWKGREQRMRNEEARRNAAARTIQSIWRAAQAREHVKMLEYVTKAIPVGLHVQQAAVQRESEVDANMALDVDMSVYEAIVAMATKLNTKPEPLLDNMERRQHSANDEWSEKKSSKSKGPGSVSSTGTRKSKAVGRKPRRSHMSSTSKSSLLSTRSKG